MKRVLRWSAYWIFGSLALIQARAANTDNDWSYVLGHARTDQQANFCQDEEDVRDIAGIFRRFSPRTGYSALSDATSCRTEVHTFTPVTVVDEVVIAKGKPNEYRVRFLKVTMAGGGTRYVVTTREVRGQ